MADIDDLKATFEQVIAALNKRDAEALSAFCHDQIVFFPPFSPFPADGKTTFRQFTQMFFANHEAVTVTPINSQFRVIGNTGLVWSHLALAYKPKDGPLQTTFARETVTYVKSDGKWLAVAGHISRIPSGD
jgi:uncharacterized protein (TIGR02246 family)